MAAADDIFSALMQRGWHTTWQIGLGWAEQSLQREHAPYTDVVTLPAVGHSEVWRLDTPWSGTQSPAPVWRHRVPVQVALDWMFTGAGDDQLLREWSR